MKMIFGLTEKKKVLDWQNARYRQNNKAGYDVVYNMKYYLHDGIQCAPL